MVKIKKVVTDILFVSKLTKTSNKKVLVFISVLLSQLSAATDIAIITSFAALIVGNFTNILFVNELINILLEFKILLLLLVILRFLFQYFQKTIIYKIELEVSKNLKIYLLRQIFGDKNFSASDSYFYVNILAMHVSYFYSSFSSFLNNLLQIFAYSIYLVFSDINSVTTFALGIIFLAYPMKIIIKKSRVYMHESYTKGQDSNKELERVVDNLFLIKILKKEEYEINRFSNTINEYIVNLFSNYKFGIINSLLPSLTTLTILTIILTLLDYAQKITLDFIGVTLRLFQSLGNLANSLNQIVNSHVHIEKFYEIENLKSENNSSNYKIILDSDKIIFDNVTFGYSNSQINIFNNLNIEFNKNSHTILYGPNGSGKSTLLGLIAGVFFPKKGLVETFTQNLAYIGATPFIFDATIRENIQYGNNEILLDNKILDLLKHLETFKNLNEYNLENNITNKTLSSGQMQKIAFVRALLSNPDILILDESTANLDKDTKIKIFKILKELKVTVINATHDKDLYNLADYFIEIQISNEEKVLTKNSKNEKNISY